LDEDFASLLGEIAGVEPLLGEDVHLTWFEILAGAAMRWFADSPVDVAVLEVGMGGRWDATNVADGVVSVVTNVGLDHVEFLGPTRADIAGEKAGVVKPGSTLVLGERDPELRPIFEAQDPAETWLDGVEYACIRNELAVGGRVLDLRTPSAAYDGVWLDLHGRYQGDNFAAALAAAEAFFGGPIDDRLVREAAASVRSPGRLEIVGRHPLVVLDGAKNLEGAHRAAEAVAEEFGSASSEILVVGMLRGKDPVDMLDALGARRARLVIACPAPSPRTQTASEVADAARALGIEAVETESVPEALEEAVRRAGSDDLILVTGSLYVVGAARAALVLGSRPS
jgi:dihydrofolate synthase/folylpolyglutamate synthase